MLVPGNHDRRDWKLRLAGNTLITGQHFPNVKVSRIRFFGVIRAVEKNSEEIRYGVVTTENAVERWVRGR